MSPAGGTVRRWACGAGKAVSCCFRKDIGAARMILAISPTLWHIYVSHFSMEEVVLSLIPWKWRDFHGSGCWSWSCAQSRRGAAAA